MRYRLTAIRKALTSDSCLRICGVYRCLREPSNCAVSLNPKRDTVIDVAIVYGTNAPKAYELGNTALDTRWFEQASTRGLSGWPIKASDPESPENECHKSEPRSASPQYRGAYEEG